ncbi:MAG: dienelactone hydrolase family protein [Proteobacteria bacterium]|nr:dienelactone hydrolase family protein [Burkholderiales bacterium]
MELKDRNIASQIDSLVPRSRVDRRAFVASAVGAGFALAVQPIQAQTVITTPSKGLVAGEVKIPTKDGVMPAYAASPEGGTRLGTVLVVQEIFGVHEYIRDTTRRLAQRGYLAVAPELYFRQGDPTKLESSAEILKQIVAKVPDAQVLSDLDATLAWAAASGRGDANRAAITGFCWGGRYVWLYAGHNPKLRAGVAWYGRLVGEPSALAPRSPLDLAPELKVPVLGLYGGADGGIPVSTVEQMRSALAAAGNKASELIVYPDAPHAFHADYRSSFRKEAAEDGWKRLLAFLKQNGV